MRELIFLFLRIKDFIFRLLFKKLL